MQFDFIFIGRLRITENFNMKQMQITFYVSFIKIYFQLQF